MFHAVPLPRAFQSFLKTDPGFIAENFLCEANIGLRMADVAIAGRIVFSFDGPARDIFECLQGVVQCIAVRRSEIKGRSGGSFGGCKSFGGGGRRQAG